MLDKRGQFLYSREKLGTFFAPGERAMPEDLDALARNTLENPIVQAVLESAEGFVMVLDMHRQVLAANPELLHALGLSSGDNLLGLRPGEVLDCTHVPEGLSGCGTSAACSLCGAVLAILAAQTGDLPVDGECWLSLHRGGRLEAIEFRIRATPMALGTSKLIVIVLVDISAKKRQDVLESLFRHDIFNTLQGLSAWAEIIQSNDATDPREAGRKILDISLRLKRQISYHRLLLETPGQLPEEIALRIFQRSFSTKGSKGRGLGTYSMKLFTETYRAGTYPFQTTLAKG